MRFLMLCVFYVVLSALLRLNASTVDENEPMRTKTEKKETLQGILHIFRRRRKTKRNKKSSSFDQRDRPFWNTTKTNQK